MTTDVSEPAPLILVVDDNDSSRFSKVASVRRAGYRVAEAETGLAALSVSDEIRPDLVLLDINLPDMSGLEVCRRLKTNPSGALLQVLHISSTSVSDHDRVAGLRGGADGYLIEPVSSDVLLATIAALLRVRRAELVMTAALDRERYARDEAERANRFKDEFLATLSHELRTPLSAMVGWIWQLRRGITDEAARHRALDALERSTNMQVRMINDLLDVSRIGQGKVELHSEPVDLVPVINAALESVQPAVRAKQLLVTVSATAVVVMGDAARLQQIVTNLLTNATKFSQQNGSVDIVLTSSGDEAIIRISDTGSGIDAALLPHVFDRFRQGEGGFSRRHAGLGIGLTIVRELVALHGGAVTAESEGPGRGAAFTVRLPVTGVVPREVPSAPSVAGRPLAARRILIVDDDSDSRAWLRSVVEFAGGSATTASSPGEALDCLARDGFHDALVSDIGMPVTDGLAFLKMLRDRGHQMPAVAVTAFSSADERRKILAAGYRAYFSKPIDPDAFLMMLATLIGAVQDEKPS